MKIIAISGGTKNGSNDAMAREALMGAKEQGAEIEFINLFDLILKPCTGCVACTLSAMSGGSGDCVIKDDMAWLDTKIHDADGVIWVLPIFEKGAPAIFKILQDRMFGPSHDIGINTVSKMIAEKSGGSGPNPKKFKKLATSMIGIGGSDWNTRFSSDLNLAFMVPMWQLIDDLVFPWAKSIVLDDESVKKCHDVGVHIAQAAANPEHAKYLGDPGVCPNCHSRNFFLHSDGKTAECVVCGIQGAIRTEGGFQFEFEPNQKEHAHNLVPGKMKHMEDIGRNEGLLIEQKKLPEFKMRHEKYRTFIAPTKPPRA